MNTYLLLGRNGDLCSVLPMLRREPEKPRLIVSRDYASLLSGVSYVEPVVFDGPVEQLQQACDWGRFQFGDIKCLQVVGDDKAVRDNTYKPIGKKTASTTSFVKDMWKCGGWLKEWDEQHPLFFDRRSLEREAELRNALVWGKRTKKKLMLVAADGHSSPFPYKELLLGILTLAFGKTHNILELPKAEYFYDLCGLYEVADVLVSIDSGPLHLANAFPELSVIALVNDKPMLWNGSPWRPNHLWYCRYSDFPQQAINMVEAIKRVRNRGPREPGVLSASIGNGSIEGGDWGELKFSRGMYVRENEGAPYLRDCLRMCLQRCGDRPLVFTRTATVVDEHTDATCYAYRIHKGSYVPVVDYFRAPAAFWKTVLSELPDLLLGNDYWWSHCLWAIFKKHGAIDVTGTCHREATDKD